MNQPLKITEINLTRTIDASPEQVFDAWLDHTCPGSPWFGVPKAIVYPPQVDSLFYSMYQLEGREIAHYGRFIALQKPRKIQHTWVSEATRGMESIVTLSFEAVLSVESAQQKTQVHIHHANVPDDEAGHHHENAWKYVLAKMSARFRSEKS